MLETGEDVLRKLFLVAGVESDSGLSILEVEEHGTVVLLHQGTSTAPSQVHVNHDESGVLNRSDLLE